MTAHWKAHANDLEAALSRHCNGREDMLTCLEQSALREVFMLVHPEFARTSENEMASIVATLKARLKAEAA